MGTLVLSNCGPNKGLDESAQMRRHTRTFAAVIHKVWMKMKTRLKFRPLALLDKSAWAFKGGGF